jgi:hypothetical protein
MRIFKYLLFLFSVPAFAQYYYPPVQMAAQNPSGQIVAVSMDSSGNLYTDGAGSGTPATIINGYIPPAAMTAQGPNGTQVYVKADLNGNIYVNCTTGCSGGGGGSVTHLIGTTSAPTVAAGTAAGTSPTIAVSTNPASTDLTGYINLTSGSSPVATANVFTVTFNQPYAATPKCFVWPNNAATLALVGAASQQVFSSNSTTTTFTATQGTTALSAATVYSWGYVCAQ